MFGAMSGALVGAMAVAKARSLAPNQIIEPDHTGDALHYLTPGDKPCGFCGRDQTKNKGSHSCDGCGAPYTKPSPYIAAFF